MAKYVISADRKFCQQIFFAGVITKIPGGTETAL